MTSDELYNPSFVRGLFNEMARTYGFVNLVSSFGFARRWRRQCVREVDLARGATVLDLMTGMGELCPDIASLIGCGGTIVAVDISPVMCERASQSLNAKHKSLLQVIESDALDCPVASASVDYVFCSFGLKTLNDVQTARLAREVRRVLRAGGQFAFVEISLPRWRVLRWPYLAYINHVIPMIGRLALGNPECYRLLGVYTMAFDNCDRAAASFAAEGMEVSRRSYFWGCASGFVGCKPVFDSD